MRQLRKLKFAHMKSWSKSLFSTCHYNPGPDTTYNFSFNTIKKSDNGPPELIGWKRTCEDAPENTKKQKPKRSMSLSPGWKLRGSHDSLDSLSDVEDEVELFLEKYVLPLQESTSDLSQIATSEYDSGLQSIETSSSKSVRKQRNKKIKKHEESPTKLVTIVNISGDITSFKTVFKRYPQAKNSKIARSKTLPPQSSLYRNNLKVTVNGTGFFEFKEQF